LEHFWGIFLDHFGAFWTKEKKIFVHELNELNEFFEHGTSWTRRMTSGTMDDALKWTKI
jgi:hypothetical protein